MNQMGSASDNQSASLSKQSLRQQSSQDAQYAIQQIIGAKIVNGKRFYKIWWKNYPKKQATWEPFQNLQNCQQALVQFNRIRKQQKIKKNKQAKITSKNYKKQKNSFQKSKFQSQNQKQNDRQNKQKVNTQNQQNSNQKFQKINENDKKQLKKMQTKNMSKNQFSESISQIILSESQQMLSEDSDPVRQYAKYIQQLKKEFPEARSQYKSSLISRAVQTDIWFRQKQTQIIKVLRCERRGDNLIFEVALKEGNNKKTEWMRNQVLKQLNKSKIIQFYQKNIIC